MIFILFLRDLAVCMKQNILLFYLKKKSFDENYIF